MKAWVEYYANGANRLVVEGAAPGQIWLQCSPAFVATEKTIERQYLQRIADTINAAP
jgi:hypothetical protein